MLQFITIEPRRTALMLFTAAIIGGCGGTEEPKPEGEAQPYDTEPPLIEPSMPSNSTTLCAPGPDAQATAGSKVYYRYNNQSSALTWTTAKADCEAMGGKLAAPLNTTENAGGASRAVTAACSATRATAGSSSDARGRRSPVWR